MMIARVEAFAETAVTWIAALAWLHQSRASRGVA
jgi:hypothetical protein